MQFDRLGVVLVAALLAGRAHAAEDIRVMPRDFTIAAIMDGYSVALGCSETMLRVVERTAEQCADLLALAKKTCPAKIADGLPDKLDECDAYRLASLHHPDDPRRGLSERTRRSRIRNAVEARSWRTMSEERPARRGSSRQAADSLT
jgi:hypothetical protein